jgi:hypothetical protein
MPSNARLFCSPTLPPLAELPYRRARIINANCFSLFAAKQHPRIGKTTLGSALLKSLAILPLLTNPISAGRFKTAGYPTMPSPSASGRRRPSDGKRRLGVFGATVA